MEGENTIIISVDKQFVGYKKRNFYITNFLLGFLWMLFHFTVVFFFTFQLKSIALVGIFLGIGNAVSFLVDIPIGILQKYFKAKTLYLFGASLQLVAMAIFSVFIFQIASFITTIAAGVSNVEIIHQTFNFLFGNFFNIIMIILASVCYGITKEINDVTGISYMMNHISPAEYSEVMSRVNIFAGIGEMIGLILAGVIMTLEPKLIVFSLILMIGLVLYFMSKFFDNADDSVSLADIKELKVSFQKTNVENFKEYVVETVKKQDLKSLLDKSKYIFLKPKELKLHIDWKEIYDDTKKEFVFTFKILAQQPLNITIYWTMVVILTMGFWDTFGSTFLIDFLDGVKHGWSYVLLGVIAIPAFLLQEPFCNLGRKIGVIPVTGVGLLLSGGSLLLLGILGTKSVMIIVLLALLNSAGYAASMALGQMYFLDVYNKEYARYMDLKEIDANASAGPMKILQNLANVIGLFLGGVILDLLGYSGFFIVFGAFVILIFAWTVKMRKKVEV